MGIYEEKRAELAKLCKKFEDFGAYKLDREKFNEFYENGNRLNYENEYFARRGCLTARAADAIINKNGAADAELIKIIDAVCDEFTWSLPAHREKDAKTEIIDLFAAETAQTLSEIMHYTHLPEELCGKIRALLRERIIEPYENGIFWWESSTHNWAAVCAGCVGMVYLYEFPERFPAAERRILKTLDTFISGYGGDGACLEGLMYWNYGFGYFVYFAELLRRKTGRDLLSCEKIAKIAEFGQYMLLGNGACVSFSDSPRTAGYNVGLTHFLRREFGERIEIPDAPRADYDDCYRFAPYIRSFLWADESLSAGNGRIGEKYFADAQWYVNRKDKFAFAAKGGNNGEPHNHNDVGSFIIVRGGKQLIADLGAGEYTRDYFDDSRRYEYFCTSSRGHSVPIADGEYQKNGARFRARSVKAENGEFTLDISGAYGSAEITELKRTFVIGDTKILLRDSFNFRGHKNLDNRGHKNLNDWGHKNSDDLVSPTKAETVCGDTKSQPRSLSPAGTLKSELWGHKIIERLVSPIKPVVTDGDTKINDMTIRSDITPDISEITVKNHSGENEVFYTLDYETADGVFECEFIFA